MFASATSAGGGAIAGAREIISHQRDLLIVGAGSVTPFREAKKMRNFLSYGGWIASALRPVRAGAPGSAIADSEKIEAPAFFACSMRTNGVRRSYRDAA